MSKVIFFILLILGFCFKEESIKPSEIRVEVLNATGEMHLARIISMELRRMGFDVIRFDNASDTLSKTVIVERISPDKKYAKVLAKFTGIKRIDFEPDPQKLTDVSLIIGKDYKKIFKDLHLIWR
ncbi:MAG: LytR C-terminal domain-containing protein [Candidatus Hydrothermales bacterium]